MAKFAFLPTGLTLWPPWRMRRRNVLICSASMAALQDHIQIVLAGLAAGRSELASTASDPALRKTVKAMVALGADIDIAGNRTAITGTGNGCLLEPAEPLVLEADATPALLLAGLLAAYDMPARILCRTTVATDDADAVVTALGAMGAQLATEPGPPFACSIARQPSLHPVVHQAAGWSEAVTAAVLLAALNTPGTTGLEGVSNTPTGLQSVFARFGIDIHADPAGRLMMAGQQMVRPFNAEGAS